MCISETAGNVNMVNRVGTAGVRCPSHPNLCHLLPSLYEFHNLLLIPGEAPSEELPISKTTADAEVIVYKLRSQTDLASI